METVNRYPRGYICRIAFAPGGDPVPEITNVSAQPSVEVLMKVRESNSSRDTSSWSFQGQVIALAAKLFGNFRQWLLLQLTTNDNIYDLNLRFLQDTVQFIRTGQRLTSVQNWLEMLAEYPDARPGCAGQQRADAFDIGDTHEFDDFISMWCSKEGGFEDMLCTMNVLFGPTKSTAKAR